MDKSKVFLDRNDYKRFIINLRKFNTNSDYKKRDFIERKKLENKPAKQGLNSRYRELSPDTDKLIEIVAYCQNTNHYHLLLKQVVNRGVSKFMHKLSLGYTNYFNKKYNHSGYLFQGRFKSIHIDSNEYLTLLSAYININPKFHKTTYNLNIYPWSSYLDYINQRSDTLCNKEIILNQFSHRNHTYKN